MFRRILSILRFGQPYLQRYWGRFLAGIILGALFGLSNGTFVWATKTIFERLDADHSSKSAIVLTNEGPAKLNWSVGTNSSFNINPSTGTLPPGEAASLAVTAAEKKSAIGGVNLKGDVEDAAGKLSARIEKALDPWLPLAGRPIDWRQVLGGFLLLPVLVAIRSFLGYFSSYCMNWVSERMMNDLRYDVLAKLYQLSLDFFNRSTTGDLLTRINNDTSVLHKTMTNGLSDIVKEPFTIVGALLTLMWLDWKLTLVAIVFLPLCIIPLVILGKKVRKAVKASLSANISQSSQLVEVITSIRVIKAFGLEKDSLKRFSDYCKQIIHHDMKSVQARELVNPLVEIISMLGLGLLIVVIFVSGTQLPQLVAFLMGVILMFTPVKKLAAVHVLFQQASVGIERLQQLFAEQPSVKELAEGKKLTGLNHEMRFEHVRFAYKDKIVIDDLTLAIPRGTKLGIAGESGSGKSTLLNLVCRFYDTTSGAVLIDGHNVRDVTISSLREQMALVSQEVVIFDQSVAENIACGKQGATREEVIAAAKAAYAHDFIMAMEQGYDTRLGERGVTLSGGQRARICIARAFVRNAPILVLDEATGNLDPRVEGEVQVAIDRLEENRTVICVAHRLATLASMDRIIVMDEGRIVEDGTFEGLLTSGGRFADMARRQGIYPGSSMGSK
ncbi:MAG TPA: ABC transporter ATP-binding protein [Verrucomicrobiae bacterium]